MKKKASSKKWENMSAEELRGRYTMGAYIGMGTAFISALYAAVFVGSVIGKVVMILFGVITFYFYYNFLEAATKDPVGLSMQDKVAAYLLLWDVVLASVSLGFGFLEIVGVKGFSSVGVNGYNFIVWAGLGYTFYRIWSILPRSRAQVERRKQRERQARMAQRQRGVAESRPAQMRG